ncbi:MAG: hypothetical protein ACOX6K_08055 [Sphaerochaetaceae bacterium]|jgi:hypothetical protein
MQETTPQRGVIPITDDMDIVIRTVSNDIRIVKDPNATKLEAKLNGIAPMRCKLSLLTDGRTAIIDVRLPLTDLFGFFSFISQRLTVVVPASHSPARISISSTSGDIELPREFDIPHGNTKTNGTIRIENPARAIDESAS